MHEADFQVAHSPMYGIYFHEMYGFFPDSTFSEYSKHMVLSYWSQCARCMCALNYPVLGTIASLGNDMRSQTATTTVCNKFNANYTSVL